ncbi:hypothetical protein [Streptomyces sp. NPDC102437]|uniref:hypothetical protein n=1 Tax=Streptomyces sp. NPDC102437 TaxID=3366175 RepID=UPI0038275D8E
MSAVDVLVTVGPVIALLETFPMWGPVLAVVAAVLLYLAIRETWGGDAEDTSGDTVPLVHQGVPAVEDTGEDTPVPRAVTCGDSVLRVSADRET